MQQPHLSNQKNEKIKMGRKNSPSARKELVELITNYEAAKSDDRQIYLDGDQLADIADWYATERKFAEAQEVISYGLHLHPGSTDLLIEQAYLYLDTQKLQKAKTVAAAITEEYEPDVKMLKAELLLNEGKLEEAQELLNSIEDADDLVTITDIVYLFLDLGYPENAKEWLEKGKSRYADEQDYLALTADYLFATHQTEVAIEAYNKLIDKTPYNPSYWMGLAKCHFIEENVDKTIEACDFALAADENYGEAYAYKAHSFFYLNNSDEAIENYRKAIKYKSIPPELGYMFMGLSYANKEEWQKANAFHQKNLETVSLRFLRLSPQKTYQQYLLNMVAELGKLQMIDKGFIERIIDREKKQSTIFGGGIAFPHTINQGYAKTILMFGKLEEPYQKGDEWIEFIFLVAIPSEIETKMESELLELYDDIFRIAGEPSLKEALRSVETETEFLSFSKSKGVF